MQTFTYTARTTEGNLVEGNLQAEQRDKVAHALRNQGLFPVSIQRHRGGAKFTARLNQWSGRIRVRDKAIFTGQLSTLLKAGMRLSPALATLVTQTENKLLARILEQVHHDVEQSSALSAAMAKHPAVFSPVYTAIIAAAEQAGSLSETLATLAHQLKAQASIRQRLRSAMVYPIFLVIVSVAVVCVLSVLIIPKFLEMFAQAQQSLPWPTKILLKITALGSQYGWLMLIGLAVLIGLVWVALRRSHCRQWLHAQLLRAPMIGPLNLKLQLAGFARTLGSLLRGGVMISPALTTTQGTSSNLAFSHSVGLAQKKLLQGSSLAEALRHQAHFNDLMANMVAVGEDTGMLPDMLLEIAEMYDQDCESALSAVTSLLGPVLIVTLGVVIGFVVMAVLLPIFETSTFTL